MDKTTQAWFDSSTVTVARGAGLEAWQTDEELVRLSGAPKDSLLSVTINANHAIELRVSNPQILREDMVRLLVQEEGGYSFHILNAAFVINDWLLSRGIGPRGVAIQLRQARQLGYISRVRTWAVGNRRTFEAESPLRGYYVWPMMGFNAPLPKHLLDHDDLPQGLDARSTLLDLLASDEGESLWLEQGDSIWVEFDLRFPSRSWERLARYTQQRNIEVHP